jgi:hypothetical protein
MIRGTLPSVQRACTNLVYSSLSQSLARMQRRASPRSNDLADLVIIINNLLDIILYRN